MAGRSFDEWERTSVTINGSMKSTKNGAKCRGARKSGRAARSKYTLQLSRMFINQKKINKFVNRVETTKGFKRDHNLVFRHIASEIGELDHAIYALERLNPQALGKLTKDFEASARQCIADELIDIIFLCCYMGELLGASDLNDRIIERMEDIATKYHVEFKKGDFLK
jgi:hypothetical protein